jgi:hypothetical protein
MHVIASVVSDQEICKKNHSGNCQASTRLLFNVTEHASFVAEPESAQDSAAGRDWAAHKVATESNLSLLRSSLISYSKKMAQPLDQNV